MSRGVAVNALEVKEGYLLVSDKIGLGIEPDWDFLCDPVFEYKKYHIKRFWVYPTNFK